MDEIEINEMEQGGEEVQQQEANYYPHPIYPDLPDMELEAWQYKMRRTMQEIIPGLFLGPYAVATRANLPNMLAEGLTHVVCVRQDIERALIRANHHDHFQYLIVELADSNVENILKKFPIVNKFIDDCLTSGGKVLVHGNGGISRSAAFVTAYVMAKFGATTEQAFRFVQSKRFCANPNENFMAQLREFEPIYQTMHVLPAPMPDASAIRESIKRGLDDGDHEHHMVRKTLTVEIDQEELPPAPQ